MDDRIKMTVDEFDLLARSLHREWVQNPQCISSHSDDSIFFGGHPKPLHVFFTHGLNSIWLTMRDVKYQASCPVFFKFRQKRKYMAAYELLEAIKNGHLPKQQTIEEIICQVIPCAKDIIAEKALVGDHGNKASNNSP